MARQGRNERCACGSGLKYKRCCLPRDETAAAAAATRALLSAAWPSLDGHPATAARVRLILEGLAARGVRMASDDQMADDQSSFDHAVHARWMAMASRDEGLVAARSALRRANGPGFSSDYADGLAERQAALRMESSVLAAAGEAGVPHLGALLAEPTWSSALAAEILADMPSGPLRDLALAQALFMDGDGPADTALRGLRAAGEAAAWAAFERVVREARADGVTLHDWLWSSVFEVEPDDPDIPITPTPAFGRALLLLHQLGHDSAVASAVDLRLDPKFDGVAGVCAHLDDAGFQAAVDAIVAGSDPPSSSNLPGLPLAM